MWFYIRQAKTIVGNTGEHTVFCKLALTVYLKEFFSIQQVLQEGCH